MMFGFCGLLILLSLGGIVLTVLSDLIWTLDGLLLVVICLTVAGVFSLYVFLGMKELGWLPTRKSAAEPPAADAPKK